MRFKLAFIFILFPSIILSQNGWNMNLLGSFYYPNTNLSDIWGWEDSLGNEFALVGLKNGFSCVDVTNPSSPIEMFSIPDMNSTWRDIKSWGNYAYITTEADAGLLIVDLTDMTGNTYWHINQFNNPNTGNSVNFTSAHNLYIDENGIAYIFGPKNNGVYVANRGAIFLDLKNNPSNPEFLGYWDDYYIHDGMVRGDTMYIGCIYEGKLFVVDVSNKINPQNLGQCSTPNNFTHNAWISDDGNYVFTTDEQSDAYLAAYNISDLNNIQEVNRVQSNPGSNSIPHNTHVDGNFLITSYYRDGTTVHDITYPNHMIQVAYYDSYSGSGNGFNGCWGTYPFLSSGNIISSDRDSYNGKGVLNIYGRDFNQACYLMGDITDGVNGNSIISADITVLNSFTNAQSNVFGSYQTAVVDSGVYQVVFSKNGYISDTMQVTLDHGVMTVLDAILYPPCYINISINKTNVSCNGGSDGSANIQVFGGQPPYVVDWGVADPNYLAAGSYPVTISNGICIRKDTVFINEPSALYVNTTTTDNLCNGDCSGSIYSNIGGGIPPYNIDWYNNGILVSNLMNVSSLCADNYNFILTDSNNCIESGMLSISEPAILSSSISSDSILCYGGSSNVTAYPYGGVSPYSYNWSNNTNTQTTILQAGLHYITISDTNGCSVTDSISIPQNDSISFINVVNDISCNGFADGEISVNITAGGSPPFQYSIDNGVNFQTNHSFTNLAAGVYSIVIMDTNLCLNNKLITLVEPSLLSSNITINDVTCNGLCDGSIQINVSGGTPSYIYNWNGYNPNALCAGNFVFNVSDANSCSLNITGVISEPSNISTQILQNINDLDALVSGGVPPYSFLWNTNEITSTITPNINGIFWLLAYDNNGCVSDTSFILYDNILTNFAETLHSNKITKVLDLFGREIKINTYQRILLYIYNDGRVERKFVIY